MELLCWKHVTLQSAHIRPVRRWYKYIATKLLHQAPLIHRSFYLKWKQTTEIWCPVADRAALHSESAVNREPIQTQMVSLVHSHYIVQHLLHNDTIIPPQCAIGEQSWTKLSLRLKQRWQSMLIHYLFMIEILFDYVLPKIWHKWMPCVCIYPGSSSSF